MRKITFTMYGIKVDGKYIKCIYNYEGEIVSITASEYDDLPRELGEIRNNSNAFTDYFDFDRVTLAPSSPFHRDAFTACMKRRIHDCEQSIKYYEKRLAKVGSDKNLWRENIKEASARLDGYKAQLAQFLAA